MKIIDKQWSDEFNKDWKVSPLRAIVRFLRRLGVPAITSQTFNEAGEIDTIFLSDKNGFPCRLVVSLGKDVKKPDPWVGVWRFQDLKSKPALLSSETYLSVIGKQHLDHCTFDQRLDLIMQLLTDVRLFIDREIVKINGHDHLF